MICRFEQGAAKAEFTPVDNRFLADYMPRAVGLHVQVYLYGLMQCYFPSMRDISVGEALGLSPDAVRTAFLYWQEQGLVRIASDEPLTVEYRPLGQTERAETTPYKYANLVRSLNTLTAPRQFGMRELAGVYEWIELYHLTEGAVLALVSYCLEKKRNCPVAYMSAVARTWMEAGVSTQEEALAYIADADALVSGAGRILKSWRYRRPPTEDETARYRKWTREWGFTDEAIAAVLPRMSRAGTPNFERLDEMLAELHAQGVSSASGVALQEAEQGAKREFAKTLFALAGKAEPPTLSHINQLAMYVDDFHMPPELLRFAATLSRGANEPFGRMKKLLNTWRAANISTIEAAETFEAAAAKAEPAVKGRPQTKPKYTEEELSKLLVNLDEDIE